MSSEQKSWWQHPIVWEVLAAAIVIVVGWALPPIRDFVVRVAVAAWRWVIVPVSIPRLWYYVLVLIPPVLAAAAIRSWLRREMASEREPQLKDYFTDTFFGVRWRWDWTGRRIHSPHPFCPTCDRSLKWVEYQSEISAATQVDREMPDAERAIIMRSLDALRHRPTYTPVRRLLCESCNQYSFPPKQNEIDTQDAVSEEVFRKVRDGSFRDVVREQWKAQT